MENIVADSIDSRPSTLDPRSGDVRHTLFTWTTLSLLAAYAVFIAFNHSSGYGGSDSSGYMNSARLLCEGRWTKSMQIVPELGASPYHYCAPLGFVPRGATGTMTPTYPVGLPLLLAPCALFAGWHWGPLLLYTAGAVLTLVCCYGSSREIGVQPLWAAVGAAALACSPLLTWSSLQIMSDGPATTWCAVAFYAALRGRRSAASAACCGLAFVLAVMIRPSDFFLLPALTVVLWHWKKLLYALAGGLPLAIWYAWYNNTLWGRPWNTGYGAIYTMLEWASVRPTVAFYAQWIPHLLPIGALGVVGLLFLPWRSNIRVWLGLLLWCAAMIGLYAFYPLTRQVWWYARFILPAFPALAILGAVALDRLASVKDEQDRPLIAGFVSAAVLLASLGLGVHDWKALGVCHVKPNCDAFLELADWMQKHTPDSAIISTMEASGTLVFNDRVIVRWDQVTPVEWQSIVDSVQQSGRPLYFIEIGHHVDMALQSRTPGPWQKVAAINAVGIWKLGAGSEELHARTDAAGDCDVCDDASDAHADSLEISSRITYER